MRQRESPSLQNRVTAREYPSSSQRQAIINFSAVRVVNHAESSVHSSEFAATRPMGFQSSICGHTSVVQRGCRLCTVELSSTWCAPAYKLSHVLTKAGGTNRLRSIWHPVQWFSLNTVTRHKAIQVSTSHDHRMYICNMYIHTHIAFSISQMVLQ